MPCLARKNGHFALLIRRTKKEEGLCMARVAEVERMNPMKGLAVLESLLSWGLRFAV